MTTHQLSTTSPTNQKQTLQLYLLLKKFLIAKHLPSTTTSATPIAKYLSDVPLSMKLDVISRLLQDTQANAFSACNVRFVEILMHDEELANVVRMGQQPNSNSMGGIWREALLKRPMDEKVRGLIMEMTGWEEVKTQKRRRKQLDDTSPLNQTARRVHRKLPLGFDEIRFNPGTTLSTPEAYQDAEWKYLTKSEQLKTLRTIQENHQRLEQEEQDIVALLSKQRFVSEDEYHKLDELAQLLKPREHEPKIQSPDDLSRAMWMLFNSNDRADDSEDESHECETSPPTDLFTQEKLVRLFFVWIQENIEYLPSEVSDADETAEGIIISLTATHSKSLALLFQRLCQLANIECFLVHGAFRDPELGPSRNLDMDHWWNVCKVGANYRQLDCSWARERGFFMDPREYLQSHLPSEKDARWALISRELLPSVERWKSLTPNYSCAALSRALHAVHNEAGEVPFILLTTSNFSSLSVEGCTVEETRVRVLDATDGSEIPFMHSFEPGRDGESKIFTLHLCFPRSGDFEVELWIPKTADILHRDELQRARDEYHQAEQKRLKEEEEEKHRQQEEAAKDKKKAKPAAKGKKDAESEVALPAPAAPVNPYAITHCIATIRHVTVSNDMEIDPGVGFPMAIQEGGFQLLSHPYPVVTVGTDQPNQNGVTFRFLSTSGTELGGVTALLLPLPVEVADDSKTSAKGKKPAKAPAKKGKGPDLETEDLGKYLVKQSCPLEIALMESNTELNEEARCLEFTFHLPLGCEGRSFEIACDAPALKYRIDVAQDAVVSSPAVPLIPERCPESTDDDRLYVPLPFEWRFSISGAALSRAFIEGKKPIDCKKVSSEEQEERGVQIWEIPAQKKGTHKIIGCFEGESDQTPLLSISL